MSKRDEAKKLAKFYFTAAVLSGHGNWSSDNDAEVETLVDLIIDAAKEPNMKFTRFERIVLKALVTILASMQVIIISVGNGYIHNLVAESAKALSNQIAKTLQEDE